MAEQKTPTNPMVKESTKTSVKPSYSQMAGVKPTIKAQVKPTTKTLVKPTSFTLPNKVAEAVSYFVDALVDGKDFVREYKNMSFACDDMILYFLTERQNQNIYQIKFK